MSRFANMCLRIVLIDSMDLAVIEWPNAGITIYVDDASTKRAGKKRDVVQ